MKSDIDTPEQKLARSNNGGDARKGTSVLDMIWDEVQATNRAAGPWGTVRPAKGKMNGAS